MSIMFPLFSNGARFLMFAITMGILTGVMGLSGAVEPDFDLKEKWTGDFDGMVERNQIRALVPYSKTFYFLDKGSQRGITHEGLKLFEKHVNNELKRKHLQITVVVIPTKRDQLLPGLVEGIGDIASGNLTITPERQKLVDFAAPNYTGVDEIIVTGPGSPQIKTLDDLSGKEIHVRKSSSYYESLQQLNVKLKKLKKQPAKIIFADEYLEDEDLLEMMNARLIPAIVMDNTKARFWAQIFKDLKLRPDITLRTGGQIAWAFRKNSPKLKKAIDAFVKTHKQGTLTGNVLLKRYLGNAQYVRNALDTEDRKRFQEAVEFFKKYAKKYDFDWLMVAALAYQESSIDQSKRSHVGAVGVMQLLPSTAADRNVNIPDISGIENNIHAGVKYLRFLRDRYFEKEPMDRMNKMLFSFASYNAGPAKVTRLRAMAKKEGFDPNIWFRNVEITAADRIGRETVQYVNNIYKYYIAYRLFVDKHFQKEKVKKQVK